jgi:hypothetical protein
MERAEYWLKFIAIFALGTLIVLIDLWYHGMSIMVLFQHWFPFTWITIASLTIATITD